MFGVFNINKRVGWKSHGVIQRVRRLARPAKVGHAGTLDPLAGGVLVVCVGPATRLLDHVRRTPKEYRATFLLGQFSVSDDFETDVEHLAKAPQPTLAEVDAAVRQFVGEIEQRPPAFSAVKVEGWRSYELARVGVDVELTPRPVTIHRLAVVRYEYPELELDMRCSSGTYVRSVGRDLAAALGTRAVMSALVRTAVGAFRLEDAVDAAGVSDEDLLAQMQSPLSIVGDLPRIMLTAPQAAHVYRGMLLRSTELALPENLPDDPEIVAVDEQQRLLAILKQSHPGLWRPSPNFRQTE